MTYRHLGGCWEAPCSADMVSHVLPVLDPPSLLPVYNPGPTFPPSQHPYTPASMSEPSTSQLKAKAKVADTEPIEAHAHPDEEDHSGSDDNSGPDADETGAGSSSAAAQMDTPSTAGKKKKKKRSKAAKALSALKGAAGKDAIPDDVVQIVLDKVKAEGGAAVASADAETVRMALEQMKLREVLQGKTGVGGKNRKETGGHKVCVLRS